MGLGGLGGSIGTGNLYTVQNFAGYIGESYIIAHIWFSPLLQRLGLVVILVLDRVDLGVTLEWVMRIQYRSLMVE